MANNVLTLVCCSLSTLSTTTRRSRRARATSPPATGDTITPMGSAATTPPVLVEGHQEKSGLIQYEEKALSMFLAQVLNDRRRRLPLKREQASANFQALRVPAADERPSCPHQHLLQASHLLQLLHPQLHPGLQSQYSADEERRRVLREQRD